MKSAGACVFLINAVVAVLLSHAASQTARAASDECALTVHVTGPNGRPIRSTWIELIDPEGKIARRQMMDGPVLKICDFGFGPHTLRIGTNECLPVAISNLRVALGSPLSVVVPLNSCGYRNSGRTGYFLYFRVVDDQGAGVGGVDFSPRITDAPQRTDSYGRYQTLFTGERELVFTKDGYLPATVHVQGQKGTDAFTE